VMACCDWRNISHDWKVVKFISSSNVKWSRKSAHLHVSLEGWPGSYVSGVIE
jgi:hypothetical protein